MSPQPLQDHTLYYGDNLDILRLYIPDESIDLIYLDPPFNSSRNYNVLFKEGKVDSTAQIHAFEDTWEWTPATIQLYHDLTRANPNPSIAILIDSLAQFIGHNPMMAYLVNMTARLIPLSRILKSTGSLYLHCDPTASHYLKIILDTIFSPRGFRNEIIWRRYGAHNDVGQGSRHFGRVHDILLFYTKSDLPTWNQVFTPLDPKYVESTYRNVEPETGRRFATTPLTGPGGEAKGNPVFEWKGHTRAWRYSRETMERLDGEGRLYYSRTGYVRQKLYLDESKGIPVQDEWDDISSLSGAHAERLGYPTQKPEALLERIIAASSNEGDWILDPFCGCGTSVAVAQRLNRHWIGIDVSIQAINVIKQRLQHHYPGIQIRLDGIPMDYESACSLAEKDKIQFQDWAISLIDAYAPSGVTKKGADRGIDGFILFYERVDYQKAEQKQRKIIVQVKGGVRERRDIATLKGDMERENAPMGVFITLLDPTPEMNREAALAGTYSYSDTKIFPKVQILSIKEWFQGKGVTLPSSTINPFKLAEVKADQQQLFSAEIA